MRLRRCIVDVLLVAVLVAGMAPSVALAGAPAPWTMVDADGRAASGDCDATDRTFRKIQAAIDAAKSGDRIAVCPGVYRERLTLDASRSNLRIAAEVSFQAILVPPAGEPAPAIDITAASNTWVGGFVVRWSGWIERLPIPVLGVRICRSAPAAIVIRDGSEATIRGVRITGGRACGYRVGIDVRSSSAELLYDTITNFLGTGVRAGTGSRVRVFETEARFLHPDRSRALPGSDLAPEATGFDLDGAAGARVESSSVFSVPARGRLQPTLWAGVTVRDTPGPVRIQRTRVLRTIRAGFLVQRSPQVRLLDVRTRGNWGNGIELDDVTGTIVRNGFALVSYRGITLGARTAGVRIANLQSRDNRLLDCQDASSGSGSAGTANVWSNVVGSTSDPPGLCSPIATGGPTSGARP
jgi:hypothetical protein